MSANFNEEDDETWLYGAADNEEIPNAKKSNDTNNTRKFGK